MQTGYYCYGHWQRVLLAFLRFQQPAIHNLSAPVQELTRFLASHYRWINYVQQASSKCPLFCVRDHPSAFLKQVGLHSPPSCSYPSIPPNFFFQPIMTQSASQDTLTFWPMILFSATVSRSASSSSYLPTHIPITDSCTYFTLAGSRKNASPALSMLSATLFSLTSIEYILGHNLPVT